MGCRPLRTGLGSSQTLVEHWDGSAWSLVFKPDDPGSYENELDVVTADQANDVWATGNYVNINYRYQTLMEHWDRLNMVCSAQSATRGH